MVHTFLRLIASATGPIGLFEFPAHHPLILEQKEVDIKHPILVDKLLQIVPLESLEEQCVATRAPQVVFHDLR
jgi:hypothetical protein